MAQLYRADPSAHILVTCYMGWNRSGLVTGLALNQLFNWTTDQIVGAIQRARGANALGNQTFRYIIAANNRHDGPRLAAR